MILMVLFQNKACAKSGSLDFEDYLNNSLRGRIPGLALDFSKTDLEPISIVPYGFVQLEFHADSRQVVGLFENLSVLYPAEIIIGANGKDVNAHPQAHLTPRRSDIGVLFIGPRSENSTSLAVIETDFSAIALNGYATTVASISTFGLNHAFGYLSYNDWAVLIGQYWHPLVEPECWPEVVDDEGVAITSLVNLSPQIRAIKTIGNTNIALSILSQRDFQSFGPLQASTEYIRNAVVPNINIRFTTDLEWLFFGASFDYKRLLPRLSILDPDFNPIKQESVINSFIGEGFIKFNFDDQFLIRAEGAYIQNGADLGALSGYGSKMRNSNTNIETYSPITCWLCWADLMYFLDRDHVHQLGIYSGFTKNLGSSNELSINPITQLPDIFTIPNENKFIDYVLKIIPRYVLDLEPILFGLEIALSRAAYGNPNEFALIEKPIPVNNVRVTLQFNYVF